MKQRVPYRTLNWLAVALALSMALWSLAACGGESEPGWLTGRVTIGPLAPVVQEGQGEPTPSPEVYAARQIVVTDPDTGAEVLRAGLDSRGQYRVALPAGSYVVDINHSGIDTAAGLPATVEIRPNEETRLDVAIDTGIR